MYSMIKTALLEGIRTIPVTLSVIMEKILNEEDVDLEEGILRHEEGVDLMPANIELSGAETSLVDIMSSETSLKHS